MLKFKLILALSSPLWILAAACTDSQPAQTVSLEAISTPTASPPATTPSTTSLTSNRILSLDVDRCAVPDPAIDAWDTGASIATPPLVPEIHAGLTKLTGDRASPIALELAESYTTNPDGTIYTFKLRPNLKFSDGSPVTSADVKASWERALKLARPGGYASKFLHTVQGANNILNDVATELEGVKVIDDSTLEIRLSTPNHNFEFALAHPVASVLKIGNADHWDWLWSNDFNPHPVNPETNPLHAVELNSELLPVGAGPYKLTAYASFGDLQRCVLSRNNHYWGKQTNLEYVVLENHAIQVIPAGIPSGVTAKLFSQQTIDFDVWVLTSLTDEQMEDLDSVPGVFKIPIPIEIAVFALNDQRYPLNVAQVRQTLINHADIVEILYGGQYPRPDRIVPEPLRHAVGTIETVVSDTNAHVPHELRYEEMPGAFYILDDDVVERFGFHSLLSEITDGWWEEFGIDLRTINRSDDHYSEVARTTGIDARLWQTTIQTPDPAHLFASLRSPFAESQEPTQWEALTPLFKQLEQAVDEATRRQLYAQIEQAILNNHLGIALFWSVGWMPVRIQPYVHGFTGATFPRSLFHNVWMDDTAPDRPIP